MLKINFSADYQSSDGKEIDEKLKVKEGGTRIDLVTITR